MKALVFEGPRDMRIRQIEAPVPDEEDVLIRVAFSGICGSELSGYLGHNALRKPPLLFGHEFSGTIVKLGERAKVRYPLEEGQRVTANPLVTCGQCRSCLMGAQQLCVSRKLLSASLPGSNAELVKIPAAFVHPLPDHLTFQQGALAEPIACAVRVAELAQAQPGDRVLILGMGPIGLFILQALRIYGVADVMAVDRSSDRLEMAETLGAKAVNPKETDVVEAVKSWTDGEGVQVAIDAVGSSITRRQCLDCCAAGARVVFTGLHEGESNLQANTVIRSELTVRGSFAYSALNFRTALQWLSDGRFHLHDWMVEAPLEEGAAWFDRLLENPGKVAKVLLHT